MLDPPRRFLIQVHEVLRNLQFLRGELYGNDHDWIPALLRGPGGAGECGHELRARSGVRKVDSDQRAEFVRDLGWEEGNGPLKVNPVDRDGIGMRRQCEKDDLALLHTDQGRLSRLGCFLGKNRRGKVEQNPSRKNQEDGEPNEAEGYREYFWPAAAINSSTLRSEEQKGSMQRIVSSQ